MRAPSIRRQRLHVESIEPRILFSADPVSALLHATVGIAPPEQFMVGEPAQQPVDTSTVATRREMTGRLGAIVAATWRIHAYITALTTSIAAVSEMLDG